MTLSNKTKKLLSTFLLTLISVVALAQPTGSFKGKLIEHTTEQPIAGATILLDKTTFGATTDSLGNFAVNGIPAGTYSVTISSVGYQTKYISETVIIAGKAYYSELETIQEVTSLTNVFVQARKGDNNLLTPVSTFSYSREEIFRNPGAQGDIMRALSSLPGVVSSGAQFSAIAARGQGTQDNVYMVDDIPMFNLSHLEAEGFNSGFNDPN